MPFSIGSSVCRLPTRRSRRCPESNGVAQIGLHPGEGGARSLRYHLRLRRSDGTRSHVPGCLGRRSGRPKRVSAESGNTPRMRIEGEPAHNLSGVVLYLTAAEAAELRDTLDGMLAKEPDATSHEHVMSADGQVEVTVAWDSGQ